MFYLFFIFKIYFCKCFIYFRVLANYLEKCRVHVNLYYKIYLLGSCHGRLDEIEFEFSLYISLFCLFFFSLFYYVGPSYVSIRVYALPSSNKILSFLPLPYLSIEKHHHRPYSSEWELSAPNDVSGLSTSTTKTCNRVVPNYYHATQVSQSQLVDTTNSPNWHLPWSCKSLLLHPVTTIDYSWSYCWWQLNPLPAIPLCQPFPVMVEPSLAPIFSIGIRCHWWRMSHFSGPCP